MGSRFKRQPQAGIHNAFGVGPPGQIRIICEDTPEVIAIKPSKSVRDFGPAIVAAFSLSTLCYPPISAPARHPPRSLNEQSPGLLNRPGLSRKTGPTPAYRPRRKRLNPARDPSNAAEGSGITSTKLLPTTRLSITTPAAVVAAPWRMAIPVKLPISPVAPL